MAEIVNLAALAMFLSVGIWAGHRARSWRLLLVVVACALVVTQVWGMWFERRMWQADFDALSQTSGATPQVVDDLDPWTSVVTTPPKIGAYRWTLRTFIIPHIAGGIWMLIGYACGRVGRWFFGRRRVEYAQQLR
ncbi:MAG: hypothetical protein ACREJD_10455 [Phycisphaerales bacterium]